MLEVLFWLLAVVLVYTYFGYAGLLFVLPKRNRGEAANPDSLPSISIIVAAFNEEKAIADKLEMLLSSDYPAELVEIIVASDRSTDTTHEIVGGFADRGVKLFVLPERGGKTAAQNMAAGEAGGELLVFTDATTEFDRQALQKLAARFADPTIGAAGAKLEYLADSENRVGTGGGLYWKYEHVIKRLESRVNSLIGVSGCLYAVRRELYAPIPADLISDFVIAMDIARKGYRTVYAEDAISYEVTNEKSTLEFSMRCRVIVRSINALLRNADLLNPLRHGFFAIQLLSHKVLRYAAPYWMFALLLVNSLIVTTSPAPIYQAALLAQGLLYVVTPIAFLLTRNRAFKIPLVSGLFYFLLANAAAFWASIQYAGGQRAVTWNTVR